jgi:hypothetical protein
MAKNWFYEETRRELKIPAEKYEGSKTKKETEIARSLSDLGHTR